MELLTVIAYLLGQLYFVPSNHTHIQWIKQVKAKKTELFKNQEGMAGIEVTVRGLSLRDHSAPYANEDM